MRGRKVILTQPSTDTKDLPAWVINACAFLEYGDTVYAAQNVWSYWLQVPNMENNRAVIVKTKLVYIDESGRYSYKYTPAIMDAATPAAKSERLMWFAMVERRTPPYRGVYTMSLPLWGMECIARVTGLIPRRVRFTLDIDEAIVQEGIKEGECPFELFYLSGPRDRVLGEFLADHVVLNRSWVLSNQEGLKIGAVVELKKSGHGVIVNGAIRRQGYLEYYQNERAKYASICKLSGGHILTIMPVLGLPFDVTLTDGQRDEAVKLMVGEEMVCFPVMFATAPFWSNNFFVSNALPVALDVGVSRFYSVLPEWVPPADNIDDKVPPYDIIAAAKVVFAEYAVYPDGDIVQIHPQENYLYPRVKVTYGLRHHPLFGPIWVARYGDDPLVDSDYGECFWIKPGP